MLIKYSKPLSDKDREDTDKLLKEAFGNITNYIDNLTICSAETPILQGNEMGCVTPKLIDNQIRFDVALNFDIKLNLIFRSFLHEIGHIKQYIYEFTNFTLDDLKQLPQWLFLEDKDNLTNVMSEQPQNYIIYQQKDKVLVAREYFAEYFAYNKFIDNKEHFAELLASNKFVDEEPTYSTINTGANNFYEFCEIALLNKETMDQSTTEKLASCLAINPANIPELLQCLNDLSDAIYTQKPITFADYFKLTQRICTLQA